MCRGIDPVQAMRQDRDGWQLMAQCRLMSRCVNAISQAADDKRIGATGCQVLNEIFCEGLPIGRCSSCPDNAYDPFDIQIGLTLEVKKDRRVRAGFQAIGIILVGPEIGTDPLVEDELQFPFRPGQYFRPFDLTSQV